MGHKPDEKNNFESIQTGGRSGDSRSRDLSMPATRHVGRTLESDPSYFDTLEEGGRLSEDTMAEEIAADDPNVLDIIERGTQSDLRPKPEDGLKPGEPLKTRLPGDTSSDPHTDTESDNATTRSRDRSTGRNAA